MKISLRRLTKILACILITLGSGQVSIAQDNQTPLNIGMILCDEGACAPTGRNMARGVQLALNEINAQGGILGKKTSLVIRYSQESDDIKTARAALESLLKFNGINIVLGPSTPEAGLELHSLVKKNPSLILITPTFNSDDFTKFSDRIFSTAHKSNSNKFKPFDKGFSERFQKTYNELPELEADIAYDTIYLLKAALETAGGTETEALKRAIAEQKYQGSSGQIEFNQSGSAISSK